MDSKNSLGLITSMIALLIFHPFANAQEHIGGIFYASCGPIDQAAVTIELDNHLRITVFKPALTVDEAYRTQGQVFESEEPSMSVSMCNSDMQNCTTVEGILTTYKNDAGMIEAALEYFDGTETKGDAESIQGHTVYFNADRSKNHPPEAQCP